MSTLTSPEVTAPSSAQLQLSALLDHSGMAPLSDVGWIRVTGEDRVRWLNGMTTNSIQKLKPGESNYNFFLSAQGRIQGDAVVLALESCIMLGTSSAGRLATLLDHYIIMDDVELEVLSLGQVEAGLPHHIPPSGFKRAGLLIAGPTAASTLAAIGIPAADLAPLHFTAIDGWRGHKVAILHAHSPLVPRFELWVESPDNITNLTEALASCGATPVDSDALTHLRILEGTPLYGIDIRDKELPQETAQTRALHFAKGCYLGQEIVERIRSRGNVHRTFHAFQLTGTLPVAGSILESDGKFVGELTTVATIPLFSGTVQLALGYIRREALGRGGVITYAGGTATLVSTPLTTAMRKTETHG